DLPPVEIALIVDIKESCVAHDGTANTKAGLVLRHPRLRKAFRIEKVPGAHGAVGMELEQAAVNFVRAAPRGRIEDGSRGAPVLCVVVAGQHIELLDSLRRRDVNTETRKRLRVRYSIERLVIRAVRQSVGLPNTVSLRIADPRRDGLWRSASRHEQDTPLVAPGGQPNLRSHTHLQVSGRCAR